MSSTSWIYCMPEDTLQDFNERSTERRQLSDEISSSLPATKLSPLVWTWCQVCDLDQMRKLAYDELTWNNLYTKDEQPFADKHALDAVKLWMQSLSTKTQTRTATKRSFSDAFHEPTPSSPLQGQYLPIRQEAAERCKERDQGLCVVSWIGAVEACHNYPCHTLGGLDPDRETRFGRFLRMFWPEEKVDSWHAKIFRDSRTSTPKGTEAVENMLTLTLTSTLHRFHSEGAFALRPVRMSADNTRLELEFYWLPRQVRGPSAKVDLIEMPVSSRGRKCSGPGEKFVRWEEDKDPVQLSSGFRFTMTTDDPVNKPLPDPGLLELQWHLQRILAMSGAAGWMEEDFEYDYPNADLNSLSSVGQWLDDQQTVDDRSRCSSPGESVETVNGTHE